MNLDQSLRLFLASVPPGRRLRILLSWAEKTSVRLGAATDIRSEKISKFVNGETFQLRGEPIKRICEYLEVPQEVFKEVLE